MKHLFIDGPIQSGKSTLLRQCLAPYRDILGGFSSQRLTYEGQIPAAYRITEAGDFCLQREPDFTLPGIFQIRTENGSQKHPEVFENTGVALLEAARSCRLILLDEIGGSELLVPAFRKKLYQLLAGDIPCIGVVKLYQKAKAMSRTARYPREVAELNLQLRSYITEECDGEIIHFSGNTKKQIEGFLASIRL
ncbi:MAG: nucleoside-triphosphatase [Anaerovoracaceae bacterium]